MNTRKAIMAISIVIVFLVGACNDNPCADGSACGMTSDYSNVETAILDTIVPEREGLLSGGN